MSKMKKSIVLLLCSLSILLLAGCSRGAYMPNPYEDCKTMDDAKKISGFGMTVPDQIAGCDKKLIQAIKNQLVQVIYEQDESEIYVRKVAGINVRYASGDYNDYSVSTTYKVGKLSVTVKGNANDQYAVATWSNGGYTYAIMADGTTLTQAQVTAVVNAVK